MPTVPEPSPSEQVRSQEESRRRRAAALLGEILPETTRDEWGTDEPRESSRDAELLRDVPPHHG